MKHDGTAGPVAVVIPALNEREAVGKVLDEVGALDFRAIPIVVDGRSKDGTVEIARSKQAEVLFQSSIGY